MFDKIPRELSRIIRDFYYAINDLDYLNDDRINELQPIFSELDKLDRDRLSDNQKRLVNNFYYDFSNFRTY